MSRAVSAAPTCGQARAAAFAKLAPVRAALVERLSLGQYSSAEAREWAALPAYLRDIAMVMAGIDEREGQDSFGAFTAQERAALGQALGLVKRDLSALSAMVWGFEYKQQGAAL